MYSFFFLFFLPSLVSSLLIPRQSSYPTFPSSPPSCGICEPSYSSIDTCANDCVVFQNVSMVLFNPGAFVGAIQCACTDTFLSAYPQCVDCFVQTNQTEFLSPTPGDNLPAVVSGLRQVCSLVGTLFGGVASANGEITSIYTVVTTVTPAEPSPTTTLGVVITVTSTATASPTGTGTSSASRAKMITPVVWIIFGAVTIGWIL